MNSNSGSARAPHRLRDRLRKETERSVLAAAEEVFAAEGLHDASMAQIAERAGVAVGTLYNHFKDRDALLKALIEQRKSEMYERIDRRRDEVAKEPFRKQLEAFLRAIFEHFDEHRAFLQIVFMSEHQGGAKSADTVKKLYERVEAVLKVGHREKVLRADPDHTFPVMLLGALRGTLLRGMYGAPAISSSASVAALLDFFLRGAGR
jgi:AcrR family transcriptional regulator